MPPSQRNYNTEDVCEDEVQFWWFFYAVEKFFFADFDCYLCLELRIFTIVT